MRLSGADLVVPMGGMMRSSGTTSATRAAAGRGGACRLHAALRRSHRRAALPHGRVPTGPGYGRFIAFSLWRALSAPPQDMPLALCEGRSCGDDEGTHNTKVDVDEIPDGRRSVRADRGRGGHGGRDHLPPLPRAPLVVFPGHDAATRWSSSSSTTRTTAGLALSAHRLPRHQPPRCAPAPLDRISRDGVLLQALKPHAGRRQAAAASSAALTHQPCTWGRRRCAMLTRATGPAATLPASRIHSACLKSASPVC